MGQFFGWGVMPCLVLDDFAPRMARWRGAGVQGVILRIEWERINDLDALDTPNEINLVATAAMVRGEPHPLATLEEALAVQKIVEGI